MIDTRELKLRRDGISLVPFAIAIIVYVLSRFYFTPSQFLTIIIKCAPILSLIVFVYGAESKRNSNKLLLTLGLISSAIGDALLVVDLFVFGILAFTVAHVFYINAFGWRPVCMPIALYLAVPAVFVLWIILPHVTNPAIAIGVSVYTAVLSMMGWRAIARLYRTQKHHPSHDVLKTATAIGSVLFIVSDTLIAVDLFYSEIPCRNLLIMGTYYAAQFGIALAVYN